MMKVFLKTKGKLIVLLVAVCQLFFTFCSKQLYREKPEQKIESHADMKKVNEFKAATEKEKNAQKTNPDKIIDTEFLAAGTEKKIDTHNTSPDEIIETAQQYLGVPHCMGGTSMKCMDCSGLLVTVFAKYGIYLPHNSEEQARYGKKTDGMDELKRGDLVFFIRTYNSNHFITHSGIYLGNNKFIHTSSRNGVTITSLNDQWWKERFIFGTRVFE
jgi:lipoprotein Spr